MAKQKQADEPIVVEAPNLSMLEKCAREVASDVVDVEDKGIDPVTIITIIMAIIQAIIQACPKSGREVRQSFKRPTLRQRAFTLLEVRKTCECCGLSRETFAINRSLLARASALTDPDAEALIKECSEQENLLV